MFLHHTAVQHLGTFTGVSAGRIHHDVVRCSVRVVLRCRRGLVRIVIVYPEEDLSVRQQTTAFRHHT